MPPVPLWENERWQIVLPAQPLTASHLAIVDLDSKASLDTAGAAGLLTAYRRSRSALWRVAGSRGFMLSFAVGWEPDADAIGEPDPIADEARVIHVFGRGHDDRMSPVRAMAARRQDRQHVRIATDRISALKAALAAGDDFDLHTPSDRECDGCHADVLRKQERWRDGGVRVIRPRNVVMDSQVILLPIRHVVSLGDLVADEVVSSFQQLAEVRRQFEMASGVTGLSCFANDGSAARQETPHVHLHVFGRSRHETANPFELLGS